MSVCLRSQMNSFLHQIVYTQFRESIAALLSPSTATATHSCVQTMELNFMIFLDRFSESFLYGAAGSSAGAAAPAKCDWRLMNLTQVYFNTFFVSKPLNISDWKVLWVENVSFEIFLDVFLSFVRSLVRKILFTFRNDMIWILNVKLSKRCHNFDQQRNHTQKKTKLFF